MDEIYVWYRVEEVVYVGEDVVFGCVCLELVGDLELFVDMYCFGDVD